MGHISMIGKQDLESLRAGAPAFTPGAALDAMAKHSLDFWMTSEDLPDPNNRVLVGKDGTITLWPGPGANPLQAVEKKEKVGCGGKI